MRVMVLVKATKDSEQGVLPPTEAFAVMDRFIEELAAAGIMVAGAGLQPSARSKRIAYDGAARTVTDGPFAEARELVAGFMIWEVRDLDEAVSWALRMPHITDAPGEVELRPFYEAADLAHVLPPDPEGAPPRDAVRQKLGVA